MIVYLAELTVYDESLPGTKVLRFASGPYVTSPSDTPANTYYDEKLDQPALMRRDVFEAGTTGVGQVRSSIGVGDLVLLNGDGSLDSMDAYGYDGRQVRVLRGESTGAYADFEVRLVGTMSRAIVGPANVTIKLRDRQAELEIPLQPTKYAGDNALPAGLEGVEGDLKGKPKPLCFGNVSNVPAVCVNTSKLIYQVNDGAVTGIPAVYDRGIKLTTGFASGSWSFSTGGGWLNLRQLAYSEVLGLYFAAHDSGLDSSVTGAPGTWADVSLPPTVSVMRAVACSPAMVVVAGVGGKLASSPDGVTFTARTSQFGSTDILALWYDADAGLFVAVGDVGDMSTSPDGITWTFQTSGVGTALNSVCRANGVWIAVGDAGVILTSPDAITWTARTSGTISNIQVVGFAADVMVVAGDDGFLATSQDGETWTIRATSTTADLNAFAYASGTFMVATSSSKPLTSVDGYIWSLRGAASGVIAWAAITTPDGRVIMGGSNTYQVTSVSVGGTYASQADLLDDSLAPSAGTFKVYLTGGYFRLGSSPAGLVTADVTQADDTPAEMFEAILEQAGMTSADWSAGDVTALASATTAEVGFWTDSETTPSNVLDQLASSVRCWWGTDRDGDFRIKRFNAPSGTAVASYTADDMKQPLLRTSVSDKGQGLPPFSTIVRYARNYSVQTTDLAGGVAEDRRSVVGREWREATSTDSAVQTKHPLARQVVVETLLQDADDAQVEADDRQTLYGTDRQVFTCGVPLDDESSSIDLGDVIDLTNPRFGLSGGELFRVLSLAPDAKAEVLTMGVWR